MTTFVPIHSFSGSLLVPEDCASPPSDCLFVPEELAEHEWLKMRHEIERLGDDDAVRALTVARRVRARADSLEARALARLHELRDGSRYVAEEAALELRVSRQVAQRRLDRARNLVERLPRTLAAMHDGEYEAYTASKIVDVTENLDADKAREVDARLDDKVRDGCFAPGDASQIRRAARELAQKIDPDGYTARARRARAGRKVELVAGEDAMATLYMDLPAEVAASAYARIDHDARRLRNAGDDRTLEQLRADIAAALLLAQNGRSATTGSGTESGNGTGVGALVYLHMPIDTALTMSDHGADLSGYGPIPGPLAREIATNPGSIWRKVLTDPGSGVPHDISRRRRPTQAMRELIAARDRECPYCHRPAQRCDIDHLSDWHTGGETSARNSGPKCEPHHYLKDEPGWRLDHDPATQTATITSPTGRTYTKKNHPINKPKPKPGAAPKPDPAANEPVPEPNISVPEQRQPTETSSDLSAPPDDEPPF
ncbi:HNH endonuclease [Haloechinothrix halophila]|uniref:HNH endonuclease n=1 Tax=Haloechinothrix halophila TaxID=1069073 RepID=UPI00146FAEB7|nr:HNH endonuclease signature motif containing protein [Haloechinothrix halophila]